MASFVAGAGITNVDLIYAGMPRIPNEGEELYAKSFSLQLGGGVPATMMNLGRLGVPAVIATHLGEDVFSQFARSQFAVCGVSPKNLYEGDGIPLAVTTAVLTARDRTFISYTERPEITDAEKERVYALLRGAAVVEMQIGYLEVYQKLKKDGAVLVLDMGWDDEMTLEKYQAYLEVADYFTPNYKEALKITGEDTPEKAAQRLQEYFEKVIVKLDSRGCLALENGAPFLVQNIPEFEHVDSTGAGDAFLSGFMYGIYHGKSLRESVLCGNITGGKCVTALGCLSAFVDEPELMRLMQKYHTYIEG